MTPRDLSPRKLSAAIALLLASSAAPPAPIAVTAGDDASPITTCNLRDAISAMNAQTIASSDPCFATTTGTFGSDDTITFDASLKNATITLAQGQLGTAAPMTVAGSGQTLDG